MPALAQEDVDIGGIVLCQQVVAEVPQASEGGIADAQVIPAQAQQADCEPLAQPHLLIQGTFEQAVLNIGIRREEQSSRIGHARNEVVYAIQPSQALGRQVIDKGAVDPALFR
ncbi:hypothetical protein D3C80_1932030 [compost metagenome]